MLNMHVTIEPSGGSIDRRTMVKRLSVHPLKIHACQNLTHNLIQLPAEVQNSASCQWDLQNCVQVGAPSRMNFYASLGRNIQEVAITAGLLQLGLAAFSSPVTGGLTLKPVSLLCWILLFHWVSSNGRVSNWLRENPILPGAYDGLLMDTAAGWKVAVKEEESLPLNLSPPGFTQRMESEELFCAQRVSLLNISSGVRVMDGLLSESKGKLEGGEKNSEDQDGDQITHVISASILHIDSSDTKCPMRDFEV
ncbi:hypothetical protein NQZ68_030882 [Dissostichus eleginoides]|nr:hypothetical protein NQZ68_030882 [Dissostichus eleginoides]